MLARRRHGRLLGDGARIGAHGGRLGGLVDGVGGHAHELARAGKFAVFAGQRFGFQSERAAGGGSEAAADLGAQRPAHIGAERAAGQRQRLLGHAFEHAADGLADRRADHLAGDRTDLADEVAQKLLQLGFIGHVQQFVGELHFLLLAQDAALAGFRAPLALAAKLELLGFETGHFLAIFHRGTVDIMHDEPPKLSETTHARTDCPSGSAIEQHQLPAPAFPAA